jgi:hypothetical protein
MLTAPTRGPGTDFESALDTEGFLVCTVEGTNHPQWCVWFSLALGLTAFAGHHQAVAVLLDAMPHEAEERSNAGGLLEQPGLVVAGGAVDLVGEQQTAEVAFGTPLAGTRTTKPLPPLGGGSSSSMPSMRSRKLWSAQGLNKLPSSEKCSELNRGLT